MILCLRKIMKGKKIDSDFLSLFIEECVNNSKSSTEEIVNEARSRISEIDKKIVEVERLKTVRSKLLDVITTFEPKVKQSKSDDAKILALYNMHYSDLCKDICLKLKSAPIKISALISDKNSNYIFCIKQLIEHKVLKKTGEILSHGEMYDLYLDKVLKV